MVVTVTLCCAGGIPGLQNYNMQSGLQNRYFAQTLSMLSEGVCPFQPIRATNIVCLSCDTFIEMPVTKWSAYLCRGGFGLPSSAAQQQAAQQNRFAGSNMGVNLQPVCCHLYPKALFARLCIS